MKSNLARNGTLKLPEFEADETVGAEIAQCFRIALQQLNLNKPFKIYYINDAEWEYRSYFNQTNGECRFVASSGLLNLLDGAEKTAFFARSLATKSQLDDINKLTQNLWKALLTADTLIMVSPASPSYKIAAGIVTAAAYICHLLAGPAIPVFCNKIGDDAAVKVAGLNVAISSLQKQFSRAPNYDITPRIQAMRADASIALQK